MRLVALVLPLAVLVPPPAFAQNAQTISLPAGCTGYVTVQSKSCTVSHHFTCEGDPEGWQRRIDMNDTGITYFGAIDAETQWVESYDLQNGGTETLEAAPVDRASFTDLTMNGIDTYDFKTEAESGITRFVGADKLTGESVTIDDVTLLQTEYDITAYDSGGAMVWQSKGREYISPEWRMFLSGRSTITTPDDEFETDDTPMEFIFPGEAGFLSSHPKYGCASVLSELAPEESILPASLLVTP
ncbi:MAG: hypothetical protein NTX73_17435 [Rhodobacterales bacterium]|nr:hypothetical protein [Rhodobacterales bacterium]